MGVYVAKFKDILASNINALLDKCEDPEKMIDQYMRNMESDLWQSKGGDSFSYGRTDKRA